MGEGPRDVGDVGYLSGCVLGQLGMGVGWEVGAGKQPAGGEAGMQEGRGMATPPLLLMLLGRCNVAVW